MPWVPRKQFNDWPGDAVDLPTSKVQELYENGFAGCSYSQEATQRFYDGFAHPVGEEAVSKFGLAESGAGKLVIPYVHVLLAYPGCWPGRQGQARGDCVSWGTRNALLLTLCCDVAAGTPDQVTGKVEELPEVSAEGVADGVLSTEAIYWYRRHGGDGWFCPEAATVASKESGCLVRKDYPELGVNLTSYSGSTAGKYGRTPPPDTVGQVLRKNLAHQATEATNFETVRDLLANGYGCSSCGGEGFSDQRDEWGVSSRRGSWAHAMGVIGVDDRPTTHQAHGGPLVLILNSWAKWNRGGREIRDSRNLIPAEVAAAYERSGLLDPSTKGLLIPEGSFWSRWADVSRREFLHFSGVNGWPRRKLPVPWLI